jgi:hypothetical protein
VPVPTTFRIADSDVTDLLATVLKKWHSDMSDVGVKIGVVLAYNAEGPAVKHGGYPAAGKIKPCSLKERVTKNYDAELTIDETDWNEFTPEQRLSFLDHEASHLTLVPKKKKKKGADEDDDEGQRWQFDDLGRPKLKSVKGTWNAGDGFDHVVARHGLHAIEYRNIDTAKKLADAARKQGETDRKVGS